MERRVMALDIVGYAHVKLPVTDVERSAQWYASLLGMRLCMEFVEQGQLRGVELVEPASGIKIALRDRSVCAARPVLSGFDVVAVELGSAEAVHALAEWCANNEVKSSASGISPVAPLWTYRTRTER